MHSFLPRLDNLRDTVLQGDAHIATDPCRIVFDLLEQLGLPVLVTNRETGVVVFGNGALLRLTGLFMEGIAGKTGSALFGESSKSVELAHEFSPDENCSPVERQFVRSDGVEITIHITRQPVMLPVTHGPHTLWLIENVTEQISAFRHLERLARLDPLTGLANRTTLTKQLNGFLTSKRPLALISIDLDGFKAVNDRHGHNVGDAVLVDVASRLQACLDNPDDLAARFGGDEFAVLISGADAGARACRVAQAIVTASETPFNPAKCAVGVGASIGIAVSTGETGTADDLRHRADLALYRAKHRGKGTFYIYDPSMQTAAFSSIGIDQPDPVKTSSQLSIWPRRTRSLDACKDARRTFVGIASIDRFSLLRQRIGYVMSNALMKRLAERVQTSIPTAEIGRIGRTTVEFGFSSESVQTAEQSLALAIKVIEQPFEIDGYTFDLSATIGAGMGCDAVIDDQLLDAAAAALGEAETARIKVRIFEEDPASEAVFDELILIQDLRMALTKDQLTLYYQPKLNARTESICSVEALLRWFHPTLGQVPTDKLIALAEATGAIHAVTRWTIIRAIEDQKALTASGHPLRVDVNISGVLLPDDAFADWALAQLADCDGMIGFEITETAVIDDPALAIANLERFAQAGIPIAIDDYGSGLSSLAYLKQLPANELKIDRMFVSGLTESHRDPLLVRSSIDLAHALEMVVTAEGVDDAMSLSLLRIMGCDQIQGYLISPPLPLDGLKEFLDEANYGDRLATMPNLISGWNPTISAATGEQG